ncbi:serine hydroxymethyltransferase [Anaeramoeba flamelloides]|uniref:Serine hydroxymethyltransferase n=1 Tax=Anaeramoeba flamelloides TaxID=1746091 RepID=A0AAV8A9F0_9EUKA|nr:serine hydroxymethyltransferase [Anaeramoeba flamelloides]
MLSSVISTQSKKILRNCAFSLPKSFFTFERGNISLKDADPELNDLIEKEKHRQWSGLELIASENFVSKAVLESLGSVLTNKYAEGFPGHRYYGGNQIIDQIENLCIERALKCFHLSPERWGVNVQPLSGSPANFEAYTAILNPHDRLMGLNLKDGGHLTHGYREGHKAISSTAKYFESMPYFLNKKTGYIDYDRLEQDSKAFSPKLIVCGASAYSRDWDYERLRKIADKCKAYLMCDMAHTAGPISSGLLKTPFELCDLVTTTTHKTLRGPRAGLIFYRKGLRKVTKKGKKINYKLESKINFSVFPSLQGGPHENTIAAIATALREAMKPEFVEYQKQVLRNAKILGVEMSKMGYDLVSGGTDNHLILVDLSNKKIDGARVESVLEQIDITVNKNTVPSDTSAFIPHGLRLGSPALTTRGLKELDFVKIAQFLDRGIQLTKEIKSRTKGKKIVDFKKQLKSELKSNTKLIQIKKEVEEFARSFPFPGMDVEVLKKRLN